MGVGAEAGAGVTVVGELVGASRIEAVGGGALALPEQNRCRYRYYTGPAVVDLPVSGCLQPAEVGVRVQVATSERRSARRIGVSENMAGAYDNIRRR